MDEQKIMAELQRAYLADSNDRTIREGFGVYAQKEGARFMMDQVKLMSYFNSGCINKEGKAIPQNHPCRELTIEEVYNIIISDSLKDVTERIRAEPDEEKQKEMKLLFLPYVTPFGTFSYRKTQDLITPSKIMVLDFDGIEDTNLIPEIRQALIQDKRFPSVLNFISPRGHGIKDFIFIGDMGGMKLREYFQMVSRHIAFNYGLDIDTSGKDTTRPCFLCYDPTCYINPEFINKNKK